MADKVFRIAYRSKAWGQGALAKPHYWNYWTQLTSDRQNYQAFSTGKDAEAFCGAIRQQFSTQEFFVLERPPSGFPDEPFEYDFSDDPLKNATFHVDSPWLQQRLTLFRVAAEKIPGLTIDCVKIAEQGFGPQFVYRLFWTITLDDGVISSIAEAAWRKLSQQEIEKIFRESLEQALLGVER